MNITQRLVLILGILFYAANPVSAYKMAIFFDMNSLINKPVEKKTVTQVMSFANIQELVSFIVSYAWQYPGKAKKIFTNLRPIYRIVTQEQSSNDSWAQQVDRIIGRLRDEDIIDITAYTDRISTRVSTIGINHDMMDLINQLHASGKVELGVVTEDSLPIFEFKQSLFKNSKTPYNISQLFRWKVSAHQEGRWGDYYTQGFYDYGSGSYGMRYSRSDKDVFKYCSSLDKIVQGAHPTILIDNTVQQDMVKQIGSVTVIPYHSVDQVIAEIATVTAQYGLSEQDSSSSSSYPLS